MREFDSAREALADFRIVVCHTEVTPQSLLIAEPLMAEAAAPTVVLVIPVHVVRQRRLRLVELRTHPARMAGVCRRVN